MPDGSALRYSYDKGGLLNKIAKQETEYITNITYNSKGQRENIYYGNNTKTRYDYHPQNFRLIRLVTSRNTGQDILQDLNYEYDSVGNITQIRDAAQQTEYVSNQAIAPVMQYTYDTLYRLLTATGRELAGIGMPSDKDYPYSQQTPGNTVQNYHYTYSYDALGNMISDPWKTNIYNEVDNKLIRHNEQTVSQYSYDAHGNMLTMPHLSSMHWDYKDQLIGASNSTFTSYYSYDIEGKRTRKTVVKDNITETRYYVNGFEVYRKEGSSDDYERSTLNISDDEKVFARIESKDDENPVIRYQYDNHLGSACLELSYSGDISLMNLN